MAIVGGNGAHAGAEFRRRGPEVRPQLARVTDCALEVSQFMRMETGRVGDDHVSQRASAIMTWSLL